MRRLTIALIASLMTATAAAADGPGYEPLIQKFFTKFEAGKVNDAIDELYSTNKWIDQQRDMVQNVKTQFAGVVPLVGKYRGRELIGTATIGGRLVHVTYLALYDRQPLRFEFQFYRPQDAWIIYSFSFDTKLSDELEAGARAEVARGRN
jgi:opacity protein-like surface antigen